MMENFDFLTCIDALASLSSFILALIIFFIEIKRNSNENDLKPIRDEIENVMVKELPDSFTQFLLNRKNNQETEDGDVVSELYKDAMKDSLRNLLGKMLYLNYVRPYTYETLKRKDFYLREKIEQIESQKDEDEFKRNVKKYIKFINRLIKGKFIFHIILFDHFMYRINKIGKKIYDKMH